MLHSLLSKLDSMSDNDPEYAQLESAAEALAAAYDMTLAEAWEIWSVTEPKSEEQ